LSRPLKDQANPNSLASFLQKSKHLRQNLLQLMASNLSSQVFLPCSLQKIPETEKQSAWEVGGRVKEAEGKSRE